MCQHEKLKKVSLKKIKMFILIKRNLLLETKEKPDVKREDLMGDKHSEKL